MSKFIGRLVKLGVGKESSRGVGVSPSQWLAHARLSHADKGEKVTGAQARGTIYQHGVDELLVNKHGAGEIELEAGNENLGLFLLGLFGSVSSASASGAYTHTYSIQEDNQHQSLTLSVKDEIGDFIFEKAMVGSMDLNVAVGDLVRTTFGFMSNVSVPSTLGTPSFQTDNKFAHHHLVLKIANDASGLAAASKISVKSLNLSIQKNLMLDNVCGTVQPEDILNQGMTIEGSIELNYEDRTYKNYMLDESYKAMRISLVDPNTTIGSTNPELTLDLHRVAFSEWEPDRSLDEIVKQTIQFKALIDTSQSDAVISQCILKNETASY
jgi:hypothetical protein